MDKILFSFQHGTMLNSFASEKLQNANKYDNEVLTYGFDAYSFLITKKEGVSIKEFANLIEKSFDCTTPQNAEVVRILRKYE